MMFAKKVSALLLISFIFVKAYAQPLPLVTADDENVVSNFARNYYMQDLGFVLPEKWNKKLYENIDTWLGTPYCYAGSSTKGADCSGFVTTLYNSVYNSSLGARNTVAIYKKITKVDTDELMEGDLVFFRIHKRRVTHMGLYLTDGKFVHASSTSGVIISDLSDPYYHKYYAGGGHLPPLPESHDITP